MKKVLLITFGSITIAGTISFYAFITMSKESVSITEVSSENDGGKIVEIKETDAIPIEKEFPMDTPEPAVRDAIHGMSHQKVEADKKWYFIPMTAERIERLIKVVETNQATYENASLYLDILYRWKNNDFSRVDRDHNVIWNLQNGNVGRATGILSAAEEREFIKLHYDIE